MPRVRAGPSLHPATASTGRVRVIATLRMPPLAAARGSNSSLRRPDAPARRPVGELDARTSPRSSRRRPRAVSQLKAAIPAARVQEHYRILLDGFTVNLPVVEAAGAAQARRTSTSSTRASSTPRTSTSSPGVIGADAVHGGDRRDGRRAQGRDRRRRHRRRRTRSSTRPATQYPVGLPEGRAQVDDAEGDRRPRVPGAGLRPRRPPARRPARRRSTRRTSSGIIAGNAEHDRPGRPRPSADDRPLRRRAARVARQLPRLQRADADRQRREHARDREGVRGRGRRRHGRHQLLRRRPADRPDQRRDVRGDRERRERRSSSRSSRPGTTARTSASARAGSPGTAPDAISVAAVSNSQVFSPALTVSCDRGARVARARRLPAGRPACDAPPPG